MPCEVVGAQAGVAQVAYFHPWLWWATAIVIVFFITWTPTRSQLHGKVVRESGFGLWLHVQISPTSSVSFENVTLAQNRNSKYQYTRTFVQAFKSKYISIRCAGVSGCTNFWLGVQVSDWVRILYTPSFFLSHRQIKTSRLNVTSYWCFTFTCETGCRLRGAARLIVVPLQCHLKQKQVWLVQWSLAVYIRGDAAVNQEQ